LKKQMELGAAQKSSGLDRKRVHLTPHEKRKKGGGGQNGGGGLGGKK